MRSTALLLAALSLQISAAGCEKRAPTSDATSSGGATIQIAQGSGGAANPAAKDLPAPKSGIARRLEFVDVQNNMRQLGFGYTNFEITNGRGPRNLEELAPEFERNAKIMEHLQKGWWIFIYNANRAGMTAGPSNTVLAYEAQPDGNGMRIVTMGDGTVRVLDETTFNKTPKAK